MVSMRLASKGEALDLLKGIENMETRELYNRGQNQNSVYGHDDNCFQSTRYTEDRNHGQRQVRRIQYQKNPAREHYYRRPRRNNYRLERENVMSNTRSSHTASSDCSMERKVTSIT
jgi:hypothetical protein